MSIPDNVHRLRPGDIDVIAGLGDSLVAGSGAMEQFAIGTFIEARGVSWCIGGQGDWRRFFTLPNVLKVLDSIKSVSRLCYSRVGFSSRVKRASEKIFQ